MSESVAASETSAGVYSSRWDRFWFTPAPVDRVAWIRGLLCLMTAVYFVSCWADAAFWYSEGGPLSTTRVSTFLRTGGLDDAAKWIISPLFLTSSLWVYRLYLIGGIVIALAVAAGKGGRVAPWLLWLLLVGWANRAMLLSGLTESLLSLGLFAAAIAPPGSALVKAAEGRPIRWTAGLAERLIAAQVTLVAAATFITMLGGRVWFNGLGAFALAAPAEDRTIDWTQGAVLTNAMVHETLTHILVAALPIGLFLAWLPRSNRIGQIILIAWCAVIALLGSHWLYGLTLATMVLAIRPAMSNPAGHPPS